MPWYLQVMQLYSFRQGHMLRVFSGFQGNWRPPACSTLQPGKSRPNTSIVLWMSYHGLYLAGTTVSPAQQQFRTLPLIITPPGECLATWLYCSIVKRRGSSPIHGNTHRWGTPAPVSTCWLIIAYYYLLPLRIILRWTWRRCCEAQSYD